MIHVTKSGVVAIICLSLGCCVSKKIHTSILYIKHASDIWIDLHTRFHKSNLPFLYKLRHQIHSFRQGSLDFFSYHTQTQVLYEELSNVQTPALSVKDLLAEKETNRVIDFLMGLNDNYEHIRSRILMKKYLPSLSEVYNLLDQEDSQKDAMQPVLQDLTNSATFQVSQSQASSGFGTSSASGTQFTGNQRRDRPYCTFYHRVGHVVDKCYKKHGFPTSFKSNHKFVKPSSSISANVAVTASDQKNFGESEHLSLDQIQQLVSFLCSKLQPHAGHPTLEVHFASASNPPSQSDCPIPGAYSWINDWDG